MVLKKIGLIRSLEKSVSFSMELSDQLFWDTKRENVDFEKHARFIIERVLTRGTLEDWHAIKNYYGLAKIIGETLKIRYLDALTLSFCSRFFKIPKSEFRCYTSSPLIHEL